MKALLVQPDKYPSVIEIENELAALQKVVGGWIEVLYPFDAMVTVICNEEGKTRNLPMNRALRDANGNVYDVICGDFTGT